MRIAMGIEYDGAAYHGFQSQENLASVQHELQKAISKVADHPVAIVCAGRTDARVHAVEQVIHFDTDAVRTPRAWAFGANTHLPHDIAVRHSSSGSGRRRRGYHPRLLTVAGNF